MPISKKTFKYHFNISDEDKQKFEFVILKLARNMQDYYYGKDLWPKTKTYDVYDVNNPSDDLKNYGALGLAYFTGNIAVRYSKSGYHELFPSMNIHVGSMELAHIALLTLLPDNEYADEMNNLIHYADNSVNPERSLYMVKEAMGYRKKKDFLKGKKKEKIMMEWYNLTNIIRDMKKMNANLLNGTAPQGKNPYWPVRGSLGEEFLKMKIKGILPGSVCPMQGHHH